MTLLVAFCTAAPPQAAQEPPPDHALRAVLPTGSCVLASDGVRFYRATLAEKVWRPLAIPEGMSADGDFAAAPGAAKPVLFFPSRSEHIGVIDDPKTGAVHHLSREEAWRWTAKGPHGLFGATSDGDGWELLNGTFDFWSVLGVSDGVLYALATPHEAEKRLDLVLRSKDGGKTWDDITNNAMKLGVGRCETLMPDPDHPRQACLLFQGLRGYVVQAPDEEFQWRAAREAGWRFRHPDSPEASFPAFYYSGVESASDYQLWATLGNYFQYPFDGRLRIQAFDLDLDRASYVFPAKGPKEVTATVRFRRTDHAAAFMDLPGATDFWSVRVTDPQGRTFPMRAGAETAADRDFTQAELSYSRSPGMFSTVLQGGKAYRRTVDLGRLFDLSTPGVYTVRLCYGCPFVTGAGRARWRGSFSSAPVTVRITGP
jgi:hypothetical protein